MDRGGIEPPTSSLRTRHYTTKPPALKLYPKDVFLFILSQKLTLFYIHDLHDIFLKIMSQLHKIPADFIGQFQNIESFKKPIHSFKGKKIEIVLAQNSRNIFSMSAVILLSALIMGSLMIMPYHEAFALNVESSKITDLSFTTNSDSNNPDSYPNDSTNTCTPPDSDGDGIPDTGDTCPNDSTNTDRKSVV